MTEGEIAGDQLRYRRNLVLPVKELEKGGQQIPGSDRKIGPRIRTRQAGRRHVEEAVEVNHHGTMKDAAQYCRFRWSGSDAGRCGTPDQAVKGMGIGEGMVGCLPVGQLI